MHDLCGAAMARHSGSEIAGYAGIHAISIRSGPSEEAVVAKVFQSVDEIVFESAACSLNKVFRLTICFLTGRSMHEGLNVLAERINNTLFSAEAVCKHYWQHLSFSLLAGSFGVQDRTATHASARFGSIPLGAASAHGPKPRITVA
jgi:hypothetical protein